MSIMIDSLVENAIEFNDLGAVFLDYERREYALVMFKAASQLLTVAIAPREEAIQQMSLLLSGADERIRRAVHLYEMYRGMRSDQWANHGPSEKDGEDERIKNGLAVFLYKRAIYLTECDFIDSIGEEDEAIARACAVILFNVGLAYHLNAVCTGEENFSKCLQLHEMSFDLVSKHLCTIPRLHYKLTMALLNNMAFLYWQMGSFDSSEELFRRLAEAVAVVKAGDGGVSVDECDFVQDCQAFLLNALILKPPTQAPAA